ncbi:ribokinase [Halothece sp. PCC 7418]|uniref:ribokinase n=1 Tax=Halothece sp. (strain PCC 7418) TaxID=65093 RepID=UPI0002A07C58|nr:ribokinase [Halothece sp. PCC 7418]AFZ43042.1 ribokinase [Halothece sp. PCC 7418]
MNQSHIVVFGSLNMDLLAKTSRLPLAGETITGDKFQMIPGGKGANQAIAVSRLGIPCRMVGRVGKDSFGETLLQSLQDNDVDTTGVLVEESAHTGVAMITVNEQGENQIIVIPEANGNLDESDVERLRPHLEGAQFLLMQLEIPIAVVGAAAELARSLGIKVILDPAPAQELPFPLYSNIDIITPNALEAEILVGFPVTDTDSAQQAATQLQSQGVNTVMITLGKQGVYCAHGEESFFVPAFDIEPIIDTVAAGDAFNGGLAVALCGGMNLQRSIICGSAAGALTVTKAGAQSALPNYERLYKFLGERVGWKPDLELL